jgi:hypothetical protein
LEIRDKLLAVMAGEQGMNALGTQAIAEETMNRADVRGQDLGETSKIYGRERGGYSAGYKPGALNNPKWRAILEDSLEKALQGSNVNNWATDNSSGGLAAKEARGGEFTSTGDPITGEYFWTRNSERAKHAAWAPAFARSIRKPGRIYTERAASGWTRSACFKRWYCNVHTASR